MLYPTEEIKLLKELKVERIIGIDEVGRGAWAGPVCVAGFIYSKSHLPLEKINDSKKLSLKTREQIFPQVDPANYKLKFMSSAEIDVNGIGKSIEHLIKQIVDEYDDDKTFFIIDGQFSTDFGTHTIKRVKADQTFYSVALASIIAKVSRDKFMREIALKYPEYEFEKNVGYPAPKHLVALQNFGVLSIHRKSYKPIKEIFAARLSQNSVH